MSEQSDQIFDIYVIGGGINGVGIARDAAGRGLKVGLCEMDDLANATSSASTKLFHGGLRYLEYLEVNLVRKALIERETLLKAMPHISWPMRFVLPFHQDMRFEGETPVSKMLNTVMPWMKGRRPSWLVRLGLFAYDNLGGREILPGTKTLDLRRDPAGQVLDDKFVKAFEYSDCWVEDARLVVLNARDAAERGAEVLVRTKCIGAQRHADHWDIELEDVRTGERMTRKARSIVNAGGPWVEDLIRNTIRINSSEGVRLVRGSHIVVKKLFDHDKAYFLQGTDGRIMFAIPYQEDFTLIGTTDHDHDGAPGTAVCTPEEADYMRNFVADYFKVDIAPEDIVWTYSGVRPLYDDGAKSATAATRDYVLTLDAVGGQAPLLNVFGGKITTYRKLAEAAMTKLSAPLDVEDRQWTAGAALPGGNFAVEDVQRLIDGLQTTYSFLSAKWARRLIRAYGTDASVMLDGARAKEELGRDFGADLTEREVIFLMEKEYARRAEDVVWRRSKQGLRMSADQIAALDEWMVARASVQAAA
ncbi:glycerol-3-phosphate dehydrogenase [Pontivivens insulae]|uniref:Glycerol-3-phosphate dehydrogenase n=1 Tax=Pontivivens insulae TaxID=1639689 RepID=A0A2R8A9G8_9RHOB|nr:glycerol-3-phosphate dehydrogenase [Pontivivens insulae]RED12791.1 homodimeric glycerol 3-phosphate dehydrogenase (quinone) [Pontivivens insulae]SPF28882.1 Aerobic glycerol-3-phosphate dehydrogenase [Pontivivens insulae]